MNKQRGMLLCSGACGGHIFATPVDAVGLEESASSTGACVAHHSHHTTPVLPLTAALSVQVGPLAQVKGLKKPVKRF